MPESHDELSNQLEDERPFPHVRALIAKHKPRKPRPGKPGTGQGIKSLAREAGLTAAQLAQVEQVLKGARKSMPDGDVMTLLARMLDCERTEVLYAFLLDRYPEDRDCVSDMQRLTYIGASLPPDGRATLLEVAEDLYRSTHSR